MCESEIYQTFYPKVVGFLKKKTVNEADAYDLAQDVFMKVFARYDSVERVDNLHAWIFRITNNTLIDHYRKKKDVASSSLDLGEKESTIDLEFRNCLEQEVKCCFEYFLTKLSPEKRQILKAIEIDNRSQKDLAEEMGIHYVNLKSKVQRARKEVRDMFMEVCHIEFDSSGKIVSCESRKSYDSKCTSC
ncbi:MAG: sigma-70 family RNA polymerase sigma factor [Cyclobacteriaceae bacterium]